MKNTSDKVQILSTPAFAVPLATDSSVSVAATSETDKRMLLIRLSDAAARIREEATLIRRAGFTDPASRLLRILGETVEEQRLALDTARDEKVGASK